MSYKKLLIITIVMLIPLLLLSQSTQVWENPANSAPQSNDNMIVNVDVDTSVVNQCITKLFSSTDDQQSWTEQEMMLMTEPDYENTFAGAVQIPAIGQVHYGFKTVFMDTVFYSMTAKNEDDIFPPPDNLLTEVCNEPIGDANQANGPYLDLTEIRLSFSDNMFHSSLANDDTQWPQYNNPIFGPWYIYGVGFINPEASDTCVYAMMYMNVVPMGYYPGLYKISEAGGGTIEQIGNIDYQIQNGKLYMSCSIYKLTSDPDFGPWPNSCGGLFLAAFTTTVDASQNITFNDANFPTMFYPNIYQKVIDENVSPQLGELTYQINADSITFTINYSDSDNNLPTIRSLIVSNKAEYNITSPDHYYQDGSEFALTLPFSFVENKSVYAEFSDGMETVQSNIINFTGINDSYSLKEVYLNSYPNPFNPTTNIRYSLPKMVKNAKLMIFNIRGELVKEFPIYKQRAEIIWNGTDKDNNAVASGLYLYRVVSDDYQSGVKKMMLLK